MTLGHDLGIDLRDLRSKVTWWPSGRTFCVLFKTQKLRFPLRLKLPKIKKLCICLHHCLRDTGNDPLWPNLVIQHRKSRLYFKQGLRYYSVGVFGVGEAKSGIRKTLKFIFSAGAAPGGGKIHPSQNLPVKHPMKRFSYKPPTQCKTTVNSGQLLIESSSWNQTPTCR